jgi:hypothetical protein
MSINFEEFKKKIDEWVESDEDKAYFENENRKLELKHKRYARFEEWLKHNDFDRLMYRLILEHDEEWLEKCWHNGYEAYPNNVLSFVIDYIAHNFEPIIVSELDCSFPNQIWQFKGYYFQMIYGQGSFNRIYNKADMRLLLQI